MNTPSTTNPLTSERQPERGLVSIILATYNELENIREMAAEIFEHVPAPVEVIVVDDNSPDETWRIAQEMGDPRVRVIRRTKARGLASAINRGIIESRGDILGWMDSDLCHPPALLPEMLEKLKEHDVVIGSRYVPGGKDARSATRVLTSKFINRLATLVLGYGILDYDSGFILMHRRVLDAVSLVPSGYGSYFIEFIYGCCKKELKVVEIPFVFTDRERGTSKSAVNLFQFASAGMAYVLRIFKIRFSKLD